MSELTIPHTSPLYHTGNNVFMKNDKVSLQKSYPLDRFFLRSNPIHAFTTIITDNFLKFPVNQSKNEGAIQVTTKQNIN
jgi:hypothetical protein